MRNILLSFALLPVFAGLTIKGCDSKPPCKDGCPCNATVMSAQQYMIYAEKMLSAQDARVDLPVDVRKKNWGGGSCYHASAINCLRIAGYEKEADEWPSKYSGGEMTGRLCAKLDKAGVKFAVCENGDMKFLEWASRNRLPCAIPYYSSHAINFMYFTATHAVLLDNNRTGKYIYVPRAEFESNWRNRYGGDAICVIPRDGYGPMPPSQTLVN